jgi:UDP-glucose 4-epimerase
MKYLITGGAGYIGSTICSALEDEGHTPVILDSLITGAMIPVRLGTVVPLMMTFVVTVWAGPEAK